MESIIHILRGLLGLAAFVGIAYVFSAKRSAIDWKLVRNGIIFQLVIGLLVLKVPLVKAGFRVLSDFATKVIDFTNAGTGLVFGWIAGIPSGDSGLFLNATTPGGETQQLGTFAPVFAISILPTIIFFSALTSLLYYLGVIQRVVYAFAWLMSKTMRLSGAESLSASGNIFVGQTEAPLLIKPYLAKMTPSELLCVMVGGMATIAGGVLIAYIGLLGGTDQVTRQLFATHLLTASVMSAPAALVIAKILMPQTEKVDSTIDITSDRPGVNALDAICLGTTDGVKLAVNVGAMLIVFTALVAMCNYGLGSMLGSWTHLNGVVESLTGGIYTELSLQAILGCLGAPLAWLMGIDSGSLMAAGQLLGEKVVLNEFIAYFTMHGMTEAGTLTDERAILICTYALCGFSNIVSIGIQIGGIGVLAPNRRPELAKLGLRALLGGSLACFLTACVAGMLL